MKETYVLKIIDRKTKEVVQIETRKSQRAFDNLWDKCLTNINALRYKMEASVKYE
jgi:hypothetical protein